MDRRGKVLDDPNMKTIPIYALYGEALQDQGQDWLHWETVRARSRLHDFRIQPHRHEQFFQVLLLTGGRARVSMDGNLFELSPPALLAVPALTVHGYEFTPDVEGLVLTLMDRDVSAVLAASPDLSALLSAPLVLTGAGLDDVAAAIDQLIAEAKRPASGHGIAMQALISLLLVAIHRAHLASVDIAKAAADRSVHHAQAFRGLVDQCYRQTRSIAEYAGMIGISPTHLNRVSRQVLGASALAVIERRIALEAKRHLLFSTLEIKEIGDLLGYPDPAYFTRFCTRALGMPPGAYRRSVRQGR